jgi:hypothetical protein
VVPRIAVQPRATHSCRPASDVLRHTTVGARRPRPRTHSVRVCSSGSALELCRPPPPRVIGIAEALPDGEARRAVVISGLVEIVVRHRRLAAMFHGDPEIERLVVAQPELKAVQDRLRELLEGPDRGPAARIAFSVFVAGVGKAAADPLLAEVDDADLHRVLLELASRIQQPLADGV